MLRLQFLQILGGSAVCLTSSDYSYSSTAGEGPRAEVLETRVISPRATVYHGWSTVTRLKTNDLWVVWSGEREQHVCPFGQVQAIWYERLAGTEVAQLRQAHWKIAP